MISKYKLYSYIISYIWNGVVYYCQSSMNLYWKVRKVHKSLTKSLEKVVIHERMKFLIKNCPGSKIWSKTRWYASCLIKNIHNLVLVKIWIFFKSFSNKILYFCKIWFMWKKISKTVSLKNFETQSLQ